MEGFLGAPLTKAIVFRCPGSPGTGRKIRGGFFTDVDPAGELLGAPSAALAVCAGSEHFWSGLEHVSVLRGVPPGLDPRSFGTANTGARCAAGSFPGCTSNWELVGTAPSGVLHYRAAGNLGFALYALPDRTWVVTQEPSPADLRLGPVLATNPTAPPPSPLEPGALLVEYVTRQDSDWKDLESGEIAVGAGTIFARTTATYPAPAGAPVPATLRYFFPDAGVAAAFLADDRRLRAELAARYPNGDGDRASDPTEAFQRSNGPRVQEGATIVVHGSLPYDAVAEYVRGG